MKNIKLMAALFAVAKGVNIDLLQKNDGDETTTIEPLVAP